MLRHHKRLMISIFASLCTTATWAATPSMTVGSATGSAGGTISIPLLFDPGTSSISSIQFAITLPATLSTATVTIGAPLTSAVKEINSTVSGNTWAFIIFGLNQNVIGAGTLMTLQLNVAASANGSLSLPISGIVYADPSGMGVTPGTNTNGTVTISGSGTTTGPAGAPAMPTVNWPTGPVTLNDQLTAQDADPSVDHYVFTFSANATATTSGAKNLTAAATGASNQFRTTHPQQNLSALQIGTYQVSVIAYNAQNTPSPAATGSVTLISADVNALKVYPNPWRAGKDDNYPMVTFTNVPPQSTLKIFTVSGHLIYSTTGAGTLNWHLKNDNGDRTASGIYVYLLTANGQKTRGKIAIIR